MKKLMQILMILVIQLAWTAPLMAAGVGEQRSVDVPSAARECVLRSKELSSQGDSSKPSRPARTKADEA